MQTNVLDKIAVAESKRPRELHNLSHDVNTTAGLGDVQPLMCQIMVPNSKCDMSMESLVRAAPMVAPPFARMSEKFYNIFVPFSDLTQDFPHLMAQEPVRRGSTTFVPQTVAHIKLKYLSALVLIGAKCTVYNSNGPDAGYNVADLLDITSYPTDGSAPVMNSQIQLVQDTYSRVFGSFPKPFNANKSSFASLGLQPCMQFRLKSIFSELQSSETTIPLSNDSPASFFHIDPTSAYYKKVGLYADLVDVPLDRPDIMLPIDVEYSSGNYHGIYACFRLSSFGKRLKKIIQAAGYTINFSDETEVSMLPIFAIWKSYFELFGVKRYKSFETSRCYNLLWYADQDVNNSDFNALFDDDRSNDFWQFVIDLGNLYYTEEVDVVSAHTRTNAISPDAYGFVQTINTDVDYTNQFLPRINVPSSSVEPTDFSTRNGHAFVNNIAHGQLDSELLKKLYLWTNRNTVAGRRVAELLRAQGLGAWVDSHKSSFIGYHDVPMPINELMSQSDTYQKTSSGDSVGMALGERAGKSEAYDKGKHFSYETSEFGYWVTLYAIVPKSGYCEQLDQTLTAISKFQFYNPEFDGLGMEFTRKSFVHGSMHCADFSTNSGSLADAFGLIPRYTHWKIARNLMNGDFNVGGVQDAYRPYSLDKLIDVGERTAVAEPHDAQNHLQQFHYFKLFQPKNLPIAGDSWRFLNMYPFIGKFDRMFLVNQDMPLLGTMNNAITSLSLQDWLLFHNKYDNFICQMIVNMPYRAPMLALESSFETKSEGNDGGANTAMTKS